MSGPNGDLGMSVEAGAEGEDDGFGEAGDQGRAAEATFAFSGLPSWKGEAGPRWGVGRDRRVLLLLAPGAAAAGAGVVGGFRASTCEWVPGNRSTRELRATGPLLQMGKLRPLQDHSPFWHLLQPHPVAPGETETPEGMGLVVRLRLVGGSVWVVEPALLSQHLQPPLSV